MHEEENTEATLLIDAQNAFNSLNRQVVLQNVNTLCPALAPSIINMYRQNSEMFVGGTVLESCEGTTQGDPLAMPMYAIGTIPIIKKSSTEDVKQVWYADDAAASGTIAGLLNWWKSINKRGKDHGYYPNNLKTWLLIKPEHYEKATDIFMETGIQITTSGRRYLGSALGTTQFKTAFTETKIREWTEQINNLTAIANTKPQPAYSAFNHGITSQWTYFTRVTQCKKEELQPIEDSIKLKLIPSILDRPAPTDLERQMFTLPIRLGGLGIRNPTNIDIIQKNSLKITKPLVDAITTNHVDMTEVATLQRAIKVIIAKETRSAEVEEAKKIQNKLPEKSKKSMEIASEKGASNWLSALPIAEYGFSLHKSAFRDAICMRYGWQPRNLPTHCICRKNYNIEHYLSCPTGGFPTIRHNELRDTLALFLKEVSHDVKIEPGLQELTGETFPLKTTSIDDMARLDISTRGFFGSKYQQTFFDVRVCNPLAATYRSSSLDTVYRKHEAMKRRKYERRVREIEHSSFIPFVMSCAGGSGPSATIVIKRLASLMSESQNTSYSKTMGWLRCKLNYCMLRSSLMCLRGNRSIRQNTHNVNIETAVAETNITI